MVLCNLSFQNQKKKQDDDDDGNDEDEHDGSEETSHKADPSLKSAYRLLRPSIKAQLLIYFILKYAMEILLSESNVITTHYFGWSTNSVAVYLAFLRLAVLPVNMIVGSYISNMFEDRQILLVSEIIVCIGILLSFVKYLFVKISLLKEKDNTECVHDKYQAPSEYCSW